MLENEKIHPEQNKKIGSEYFVKRVDEIAAYKFVQKRNELILNLLLSDKEYLKRFKKRLRGNSKKYYKRIIIRAGHQCELCRWTIGVDSCLQFHHILPVERYASVFVKSESMPDAKFETANLIVLCPNCHTLIHQYKTYKDKKQSDNIIKGVLQKIGCEDMFFKFMDIINETEFFELWKAKETSIFKD